MLGSRYVWVTLALVACSGGEDTDTGSEDTDTGDTDTGDTDSDTDTVDTDTGDTQDTQDTGDTGADTSDTGDGAFALDEAWMYGGSGADFARAAVRLSDGSVVIAGDTRSTNGDLAADPRAGDYDVWVLRLDADGDVAWSHTYGGTDTDRATDVAIAWDGDLLVSAWTESDDGDLVANAGQGDAWVLKVAASDGALLLNQPLAGAGRDFAYALRDEHVGTGGVESTITVLGATSSSNDGPFDQNHVVTVLDGFVATVHEPTDPTDTADPVDEPSAHCIGSNGEDSLRGFWGDRYVGATFGDATGDFVGQPLLGESDAWVSGATNVRLGGNHHDTIAHVTGDDFAGSSASDAAPFVCSTHAASVDAWAGTLEDVPVDGIVAHGVCFGSDGADEAADVVRLADGRLVVTGFRGLASGDFAAFPELGEDDAFVALVSAALVVQEVFVFGGSSVDTPVRVLDSHDGHVLVVGTTSSPAIGGASHHGGIGSDVFVARVALPPAP